MPCGAIIKDITHLNFHIIFCEFDIRLELYPTADVLF